MVQPLRQQSLLVVSERQKGSAQGRILGGPRGPWPPLFLWKFENCFYRILACFPATGFLNFLDPPPASADRLEQNLGDNLWSSPGQGSWLKVLAALHTPGRCWVKFLHEEKMIDIQRSHDSPPQIGRRSPWSLGIFPYLGLMKKDKCDVFYIINMAESEAQEVGLSLGGYDEEFINAIEDDLQCTICHLPLKHPMLTKCGHRCCKKCLDEHFKR